MAPAPSATMVLLRDGVPGLEVLLMRRNSRAGFVPEMYVFPGGRVDAADADRGTLALVDDLSAEDAAARLNLPDGDPPAIAYYLAAFREAFEETGILVGSRLDGSAPPSAAHDASVERARNELMDDRIGFAEVLKRLRCRVSGRTVEYFAHWITPRRQPRRFDTRFFAAHVTGPSAPIFDAREMTEARWMTPAGALAEHGEGGLPMILPTVRTLEKLRAFAAAGDALEALASESVETILPDGP